jgi:hypothetical protein
MRVSPIVGPLGDERALGIDPALATVITGDWRRRVNPFSGRSLGSSSMTIGQDGVAGQLAALAQAVHPGVVAGLAATLLPANPPALAGARLSIASGRGVCTSGEDVFLAGSTEVALADLPLDTRGAVAGPTDPPKTLGQWVAGGKPAPPVIVVLQPVIFEDLTATDPSGCPVDPSDTAYDDLQRVEGCQVVLSAWPDATLPLPASAGRLRNQLAYEIFRAEEALGPGGVMPWDSVGVPIGLITFDAASIPLFLDRYSVVRAGGSPRPRSAPAPRVGLDALWEARILQFAEQLAEEVPQPTALGDFTRSLRFLPPIGMLPKDVYDSARGQDRFFPSSFTLDAVPVPAEQLEAAFEIASGLAPLDTFAPEPVRLLVPVPQAYFEPKLLEREDVDQGFIDAVDHLVAVRAEKLGRRADLLKKAAALYTVVTAKPFVTPPDPDQLEPNETIAAGPFDPPEDPYGTTASGEVLKVDAVEKLRPSVTQGVLSADEAKKLDELGLAAFRDYLQQKVDRANDTIDFGFLRVRTDIYRIRQLVLANDLASRLATSPALPSIAQGLTAAATAEDLDTFFKQAKGTIPSPLKPPPDKIIVPPILPPGAIGSVIGSRAAGTTGIRAFAGGGARIPGGVDRLLSPRSGTPESVPALLTKTGPGPIEESVEAAPALGPGGGIAEPTAADSPARALFTSATTPEDLVKLQTPVVGSTQDFRNITLAERLTTPPAPEARAFTLSTKHDVALGIFKLKTDLGMNVDALTVPS